jgi:hypothetical protein
MYLCFKRGVGGTCHKVSEKHLPFYVAEFQFRYNNRSNADIFGTAISGCLKCIMVADQHHQAMKKKKGPKRQRNRTLYEASNAMVTEEPAKGKKFKSYKDRAQEAYDYAASYTAKNFAEFMRPAIIGWNWLRTCERDSINVFSTVILAVATVGIWVVAAGQLKTANRTDETLRAEQRPWLQFAQLDIVAPLHCDINGANTTVRVMLNNAGHSPALDATIHLSMSNRVQDILGNVDKQKVMCDPIRTAPISGPNIGRAVFPGLERVQEDIDISAPKAIFAGPWIVWPTVMACINYRFPFEPMEESHQTGIIWNLVLKSQETMKAPMRQTIQCPTPDHPDIQPDVLDKLIAPLGSYAD